MNRILVYPNITYLKDLVRDSYTHVITDQIRGLYGLRKDLWFYLLLPKHKHWSSEFSALIDNLPNTTALGCLSTPSHPPRMRMHFDTDEVLSNVQGYDYDLVYSHLPEHAYQLKSLLLNNTHFDLPFLGYCHWFDFKGVTTWPKDSFDYSLLGILEMHKCFVNTSVQREMVLEQAKDRRVYSAATIKRLGATLDVLRLGIPEGEFARQPLSEAQRKVVVFNHRPWKYKGIDFSMRVFDALYKRRTDFEVWFAFEGAPSRPYTTVEFLDKEKYYKRLGECAVGFGPPMSYGGWSVATTDGLKNGCPYVMHDAANYREMVGDGLADGNAPPFYHTEEEAVDLLDKMLSDSAYRFRWATLLLASIKQRLGLSARCRELSTAIDATIAAGRARTSRSKAVDRIAWMVRDAGELSKRQIIEELGWSRDIKWSPYRRTLIDSGRLRDVGDRVPLFKRGRVRVKK